MNLNKKLGQQAKENFPLERVSSRACLDGVIRSVREVRIKAIIIFVVVYMYVPTSVWNNSAPIRWIFMKFCKSDVWLTVHRNSVWIRKTN